MPLQERIIAGGIEGSGKTYAYLTIARALPDNTFYIIDPDDGVRRVWYSEFKDVTNIVYYFTPKWFTNDYEAYKKKPEVKVLRDGDNCQTFQGGIADAWAVIKPKLKAGDWINIEHLHLIWNAAQGMFADEVFDKKIGDYFLERRKAMKEGSKRLEALEGWTDWQVINKMHNDDFINEVCYDNPAHVFMTTSTSLVTKEAKEDVNISAFYGDTKIRFEGQKHNVFRVQTKLIMKQEGSGKNRTYKMNTFLKDRGREHIEDYEWSDFYLEYLCMIAGW
ncbi:MAG: hypothetical protein KKD44_27050 [Proteobacteria bacterium]|nr:hypothetical protein [Pseudomonadota bacterium]